MDPLIYLREYLYEKDMYSFRERIKNYFTNLKEKYFPKKQSELESTMEKLKYSE